MIHCLLLKPAEMRFELEKSFIDTLTKLNLRWMRDRITRMWPQWAAAAKQFAAEGTLRKQHRTKEVVLMSDCYVQLFLLYPFVYCFATYYMVRHDKE